MRIYNTDRGKLIFNHKNLTNFQRCKIFFTEGYQNYSCQIILEIDGVQSVLENIDMYQIESQIRYTHSLLETLRSRCTEIYRYHNPLFFDIVSPDVLNKWYLKVPILAFLMGIGDISRYVDDYNNFVNNYKETKDKMEAEYKLYQAEMEILKGKKELILKELKDKVNYYVNQFIKDFDEIGVDSQGEL